MIVKLATLVRDDIVLVWRRLRDEGLGATARWLHTRDAPGSIQFVKYGICGVASVIIQLTIAGLLSWKVFPALDNAIVDGEPIENALRQRNLIINNAIAFPFANLVAYLLNAMWVFTPGRHSKFKEFTMFTVISAISFFSGLLGGPLLISRYGIPSWVAQFGFMFTSALVNFVCRKFLVFQK